MQIITIITLNSMRFETIVLKSAKSTSKQFNLRLNTMNI